MDCNKCKNLIADYGGGVSCEAHSKCIKYPKDCKAFLDFECIDEKKILKNVDLVTIMHEMDSE